MRMLFTEEATRTGTRASISNSPPARPYLYRTLRRVKSAYSRQGNDSQEELQKLFRRNPQLFAMDESTTRQLESLVARGYAFAPHFFRRSSWTIFMQRPTYFFAAWRHRRRRCMKLRGNNEQSGAPHPAVLRHMRNRRSNCQIPSSMLRKFSISHSTKASSNWRLISSGTFRPCTASECRAISLAMARLIQAGFARKRTTWIHSKF